MTDQKLLQLVMNYIKKNNEHGYDEGELSNIITYLIKNNQHINDIDNIVELDVNKTVDMSWINNEIDGIKANNEDSVRMSGIIFGFKIAGDNLSNKTNWPSVDVDFYPIMTCYTQYLELVLKNYMRNKGIQHRIKSHNIIDLWNKAKPTLELEIGKNAVSLLDAIIVKLYRFDDKTIEKDGLINYRYLLDDSGCYRLSTDDYKLNVAAVHIFFDIIDSFLHYTYDPDEPEYSEDDGEE